MPDSVKDNFVHLHLHSAYSLAEGAITVKDLLGLCQKYNMPAVAITDTGNLFGAMEFATYAAKAGVQPVLGAQIALGLEGHQLVLLVQSEQGYRNLCKLVSVSFLETEGTEKPHIDWETLDAHTEGLICLSGGLKGPVDQYLLHNQTKEAEAALKRLKKIFGDRLYIELQRHGWPEEDRIEGALIDLAYKHDIPLVATNDCYFPTKKMHEAHDALLCIAEGRYVTESDRRKVTPEHYFKNALAMRDLFKDVPEAVDNTVIIAQRCSYLLKPIDPLLPPFDTGEGRNEAEELRKQAQDGLQWRLERFVFPEDADEAKKKEIASPYFERLNYELGVIEGMGFPGYFLICSDFIKWSKEHDIPVGPGRGSGAGSVVAWALQITDLDPLEFGLLFERFLNPERVSMPDFDVDFCQTRRDEVIHYVQDKYGHDNVAQIITFGKLQARAVVRDVGRVLQMPYGQVDRIAKLIPANPANPISLAEALEQEPDLANERMRDETTDKLITIALQLEGLYRHASTHAAGLVIGDRELHKLLALYRDPRSDMPVTQFNMKFVEQSGLVKFDFLGLKTMTVIKKALDLVEQVHGKKIDHLEIPFDDQKTYELLTSGQTVGVFQLESAGMRDVLRKMKPDRLEDIIALVALYRPGPMDNIPRYIDIKDGKEEPDYMHPKLQPILEETYGIMIYQEQVMQAAQLLAGYTLGGADLLRRAMGKKIKEEMDAQRDMFVKGCAKHNDIPAEQANAIFDQIAKFAGYGFNKSHAAAYAVIAYWTGWLKANYPVEFMAASMTLDLGNTDKLAVFKQDLDRSGIALLLPDVNRSLPEFKVEDGAVRYALAALKGVGEHAMEVLVAERDKNGPYKDLQDFANRLDAGTLNRRQMEQLASAGAFECLNSNRAQVHDYAEALLRYAQNQREERESGQNSLFGGDAEGEALAMPALSDVRDWDPLERLKKEFDAVGFYLSAHPLDTKAGQLEGMGIVPMARVEEKLAHRSSALIEMAGVLLKKQVKVSAKGNKFAFLQLSDSTGVYEVTLFSETLARVKDMLEPGEGLLLKAVVEQREEQLRYTVQTIQPLDEALAGKVKEVQITLADPRPVGMMKQLLEADGGGRVQVKIYTEAKPGLIAELTLPGRWGFSPDTRNALIREEGVKEVREL
ncbi:MAG: DNA polymerase III subunit alpha [Rhodospirillales bacterium]|nr:DNA polymerase III subunit alpha [Rhodospirillales bacterium]